MGVIVIRARNSFAVSATGAYQRYIISNQSPPSLSILAKFADLGLLLCCLLFGTQQLLMLRHFIVEGFEDWAIQMVMPQI